MLLQRGGAWKRVGLKAVVRISGGVCKVNQFLYWIRALRFHRDVCGLRV